MMRARIDWLVVCIALLFAAGGCGGGCGGCEGMEPIPGGFPSAKRVPNAGQVRVTQSAIAKITADPASVIGPLVGNAMNGIIEFPVPASCGGSTEVCCNNGQPIPNCGPIEIDLVARPNDAPRLVVTPVANASRVDVTVRARVKTKSALPVRQSGIGCTVSVNTTADTPQDLRIDLQINLTQDPTTGTTRIQAGNVNVTQFDEDDYDIGGNFLCSLASSFVTPSLIIDQLVGPLEDAINEGACKSCGTVADCSSPHATACTGGTCMVNDRCLQELGMNGRLRGSVVFASLSPGTTGALDLYEVAGGYATTNNNGIALGLLGGFQPGGAARDRCGPSATEPAPVTIPLSPFFSNNTRPDTNAAFDVGIGLHKTQLDQLAYAGYDGGLFCLTVGSSTVAQLSTDTIGLLSRSLANLVESNSPMAVGLRPQSPPTIVLGSNTFKDDGSGNMVPDEPLLDISFTGLEIDFFASIDDQYNRVFTVVTDVRLPIGLQVTGMGELAPVIGATDMAFTNVSVKNSEAVTESPAELANLFPTLLGLVLPQLSGGLSPIALPELGGLALSVTDVTAVDNDQFLAIYADLVPAMMARVEPVDTTAELAEVIEPPTAVARDVKQWRSARAPSITLALGGTANDLEFSWRLNAGAWSGWSKHRRPTISSPVLWLPGLHKLEVRSRRIDQPATIDREPVTIELAMGTDLPLASDGKRPIAKAGDFHGQAGESGCNCETGSSSSGALFALMLGFLVVPRRRVRALLHQAKRLGLIVWLAAIASLPGCSCGDAPCGDVDCLPGEVERGAIGRFTSIAADDKRVLVATYDQVLGDLVVVDATDLGDPKYRAVAGIPDDTTPTYDPSTYRGGIAEEGPNVGAWSSIALSGGVARVAYQNRDDGALEYAYEVKSGGEWKSYAVDSGDALTGLYASMVIDANNHPAIAYLAVGIDDGTGRRITELRLVRATSADPTQTAHWTSSLIASAPGSCGGLCGSGVCVAGAAVEDPQECVTPTADCGSGCADDEACVAGACRARFDEPKVLEPPGGTGLHVSLNVLPDGRLAATYYDRNRRALTIAVENAAGSSEFTETILDGNAAGADRGMWATSVVGGDGTVHIAYQDALGDQLMYTSWNGAPGTPVVVDDGQRPGDRPHPVGAASSIYMNGGEPAIAYQDGLVSDVYLASRSGGTWTTAPLASGPLLDGFWIAATTGSGSPVFAWGTLDPALPLPSTLTVRTP